MFIRAVDENQKPVLVPVGTTIEAEHGFIHPTGARGRAWASPEEIRRVQAEREPAPAGVTLGGLPVVWFELSPDGRVRTATLTPTGDIKMVEGAVLAPAGSDDDAVLEAALSRPTEERSRGTASGAHAG